MARWFSKQKRSQGGTIFYDINIRSRGLKRIKQILTHPIAFFSGAAVLGIGLIWLLVSLVSPAAEPEATPALNRLGNVAGTVTAEVDTSFSPEVREIMLRVRKIGDPVISGDEALFAGGTDSAGNPKLRTVYHYDLINNVDSTVTDIVLQNDDILNLAFNDKYIVWADAKRSGSCIIRYLNRGTGAVRTVKACPIATPKLRLEGDMLCWIERTAAAQDKLYLYDLSTAESVTLAVFNGSASGVSPPGLGGGEVAWAEDDRSGDQIGNSVIKTLDLGTGTVQTYVTGMYVFGPLTNGGTVVWLDQNRGPNASLYMLDQKQSVVCVASGGVTDYALGKNFVAYQKDDGLFAYFYKENRVVRINAEGRKVILSGVYGDTVVWFDVSDDSITRDIMYYSSIE